VTENSKSFHSKFFI